MFPFDQALTFQQIQVTPQCFRRDVQHLRKIPCPNSSLFLQDLPQIRQPLFFSLLHISILSFQAPS